MSADRINDGGLAAITDRFDTTTVIRQFDVLVARQRDSSHGRALRRLLAFFSALGAILIALHLTITAGLRRVSTSDFGVTNRIVQGRINAEIIITGSSRALTHYDPRIISAATGKAVFNLGRNGSQTDLQVAVLKTYLAHNAKPQLVIHNLDLYSFETSHEIYDPAQYLPYLNEPAIYDAVRRVYPDAWKWKYVPLYGYAAIDMRFEWLVGLKRWVGIEPREDHFYGFVPRHTAWTGDFERFASGHPNGYRTPIERQGIADVRELLIVCRRRNIPVLFVYSPEFSSIQQLEINRGAIFSRFAEVGTEFGVSLWDFSDSDIAQHPENFYNSQHLNAAGAERFSALLAQRLVAARFLSSAPRSHPSISSDNSRRQRRQE